MQVDLSHNLVRTKADVRPLSLNAALRRLRIEGNPFCATGVQHGTYQIAMQHLLPGMSLLDGKPPSGLSTPLCSTLPLPPPPRPPAPSTTAHHANRARSGPHRRTASSCSPGRWEGGPMREGFVVSCPLDFAGDLSVERRWRDSAVAAGHANPEKRKQHPSARRPGGSFADARVGGVSGRDSLRIRVTIGGGGPTVAAGSYADIFLTTLRKDRSALMTSATTSTDAPDAVGMPNNGASAVPPGLPERPREGTQHQQHQPAQNTASAVTTPIETSHRKKRGSDTAAAAKAAASSTSLLSYRGLSRAERAAARRLAWSQARQEGAVGAARSARQQQQRRSDVSRSGSGNALGSDENPKRTRRTLGARSLEPARMTWGRSSVSQRQLLLSSFSPLLLFPYAKSSK